MISQKNLKSVAQTMEQPRPLEVLDIFVRKSKFEAPRVFIFGAKRLPIEVNNWWKFGVDISNHFWEIQNLACFPFLSIPHVAKFNNMGDRKKKKRR